MGTGRLCLVLNDNSMRPHYFKKEENIMPKQQKEEKIWEVRFTDGHTTNFTSKINPMGIAVIHLSREKAKGFDHGAIASIRALPEEAFKRPVAAKQNGVHTIAVEEKEEEITPPETIISPELDDELYKLIQTGIVNTELVEKLFYKFYEFTQEKDEIYDSIFLKEFCKRIYRGLNDVLQDVENIEKNLEGEN